MTRNHRLTDWQVSHIAQCFFCSSKIMPGGVVAFFHTSKKKHSSWRAPKSKLHISSMGERQDWDTRKVAWGFLLVGASIITMPVAVCNHAMRFACGTRHSTLHGLNSWSSLFLTLSLVAASILHGFGFLSFDFMIFLMIASYSSSLWGPSAICHVKLKLWLLRRFPASQLDQGPDLIIWYCWWFRNPAPVDMVNIPLFTRFYTSQVVQDSFHQQYHPKN